MTQNLFIILSYSSMAIGFCLIVYVVGSAVKNAIKRAKGKPNYPKEANWLLDMEDYEKEMYHKEMSA